MSASCSSGRSESTANANSSGTLDLLRVRRRRRPRGAPRAVRACPDEARRRADQARALVGAMPDAEVAAPALRGGRDDHPLADADRSTCAPACSTTPTALCPRIAGGTTGRCPCCMWQSVMQNARRPCARRPRRRRTGAAAPPRRRTARPARRRRPPASVAASGRRQGARRELRALGQRARASPTGSTRVHALEVRALREAAVGAGDDVLAARRAARGARCARRRARGARRRSSRG